MVKLDVNYFVDNKTTIIYVVPVAQLGIFHKGVTTKDIHLV